MFHISFKHTTFMCKKYEHMKNEFHIFLNYEVIEWKVYDENNDNHDDGNK
jgi:hypothetical protein